MKEGVPCSACSVINTKDCLVCECCGADVGDGTALNKTCPNCKYDKSASGANICPACGEVFNKGKKLGFTPGVEPSMVTPGMPGLPPMKHI